MRDVFSMNIKQVRKDYSLKQERFADVIGVSRSLICQYELGSKKPSYSVLLKISSCFNVSIDWLVGNSNIKYLSDLNTNK